MELVSKQNRQGRKQALWTSAQWKLFMDESKDGIVEEEDGKSTDFAQGMRFENTAKWNMQ